jgi:ABC-type Fe3+/spermidine/putrescine transport system ATPase subunit
MDEPLSNLDARLRDEMREEIRRLHNETRLTMVYVTHDQKEALALADRLAVMDRGRLVQVGRPAEVYARPATRFVAGFLGESNFIPGTVRRCEGGQCIVETALGELVGAPVQETPAERSAVTCSIRPQALSLSDAGPNRLAGTLEQVAFLGELVHLRVAAANGQRLLVTSLPHGANGLHAGDPVRLSVPAEQVVLLRE